MSENGHDPELAEEAAEPEAPQQADGGVPDRFDAGDGHGEYVYRRRGPFGRLRARMQGMLQVWLEQAAPRDADQDHLGPATRALAGSGRRQTLTLTVAALVGLMSVMIVLVLVGL